MREEATVLLLLSCEVTAYMHDRASVVIGCSCDSSIEISNVNGNCEKCGACFFTFMLFVTGILVVVGGILLQKYTQPIVANQEEWGKYRYSIYIIGAVMSTVALIGLCTLICQIRCCLCFYILLVLVMALAELGGVVYFMLQLYPSEEALRAWLISKQKVAFSDIETTFTCCGPTGIKDYSSSGGSEPLEAISPFFLGTEISNNNPIETSSTAAKIRRIYDPSTETPDGKEAEEDDNIDDATTNKVRILKTKVNRKHGTADDLKMLVHSDVIMLDPRDMILAKRKENVILSPIMLLQQPRIRRKRQIPSRCCAGADACTELNAYKGCDIVIKQLLDRIKLVGFILVSFSLFFAIMSFSYFICVWKAVKKQIYNRKMGL